MHGEVHEGFRHQSSKNEKHILLKSTKISLALFTQIDREDLKNVNKGLAILTSNKFDYLKADSKFESDTYEISSSNKAFSCMLYNCVIILFSFLLLLSILTVSFLSQSTNAKQNKNLSMNTTVSMFIYFYFFYFVKSRHLKYFYSFVLQI
jgi:hypothetical protein